MLPFGHICNHIFLQFNSKMNIRVQTLQIVVFVLVHQLVLVVIQGIIDLAFKEADGWVVLDYKSNYAGDDESLSYLTSHYRRQLELYGNAWTRLTGENVKEKYLYFVRGDRLVKLD